jgi:hypothetical protein
MKRLALIAFIPLGAFAADFSAFPGRHSCKDIRNSQACARALESALNAPYISRSSDTEAQIALLDGRFRRLKDQDPESGGVAYSVIEIALDGRFLVVHRQFYEGSSYSLLDRSDGRIIDLSGYPVFSPDSNWVAVAEVDLGAGYSPNALQIFKYSNGFFSLSFDAKPDRWGPERVTWQSPTQLSYVHATVECQFENTSPCRTVTLTLGTDGWR